MTEKRDREPAVPDLAGGGFVRELEGLDPTLQSIVDQIPDNVMVVDREYRIRYINWTVPGLSIERVMGTLVLDYVPEKHRESVAAGYARAFATGKAQRAEYEYYAADGAISKWVTRIAPLTGASGTVDRLLLVSTDVTEREEAARDRDRFFRLSVDMLCVATLAGLFKRVSPAFTTVLGWDADELLSKPFLEFVHPEDRASTAAAVERLRRAEGSVSFENRCLVKGGGHRLLEWNAIAETASGLIYAVARDVSERRELEAELRQSRKMESIGQLAGGVAHDFNNLLLAIQLNAELAAQVPDDARRTEFLQEIQCCARRAAELTRQLLVLGRKQLPRSTAVELGPLVGEMLRMLRRTIPANVLIEIHDAAPGIRVQADRAQLEQVVLNLCLNARDAMPDGGRLTVRIERMEIDAGTRTPSLEPGSYAALIVTDTGIGMREDVAERVFEPFFTTKPAGSGTGLGLATVYGIVKQHRGAVRVETQLGVGSSFRVLLPETDAPLEAERPVVAQQVGGGAETILVADDFEPVLRVVTTVLEGAGYKVLTARDGEEALEIIRRRGQEIALVLLDLVMPGPSVVEVARLALDLQPGMRLLFTSGYTQLETDLEISEDRLLRKPYAPEALLAAVRRAISEPRAPLQISSRAPARGG